MICIKSVINHRYPEFSENKPLTSRTLIKVLRIICHEKKFHDLRAEIPHAQGFDFVEQVLEHMDFTFRVKDSEKKYIPRHGRVVIVANHPLGSLDGLALLKMVGDIRPDVKAVANELLFAFKPLRSLLLPVDNMGGTTSKEQLKAIRSHLNDEGAIIIFPAGEVSRVGTKGIKDGRWNNGFLRFAKATDAPILPVFVDGRNSILFYSLSLMAKPISTLWLAREIFKQKNNDLDINVGPLIYPEQYNGVNLPPKDITKLFKEHVYRLPKKNKNNLKFAPEYEAIANPEDREWLKKELANCEQLGTTADEKIIYLYRYQTNSVVMREISRLRELSFRAVKEGTGKRRDSDLYDQYYDHLVLWDNNNWEIVGAYRMLRCSTVDYQNNDNAVIYSQTLYNFSKTFKQRYFAEGLELGRSFVQPKYQGRKSLSYLWQGIGAYLIKYPNTRYLFGPVSISHDYPETTKDMIVTFYCQHFGSKENLVSSKSPYAMKPESEASSLKLFPGIHYHDEFKLLKRELIRRGVNIPTLYKQYAELSEPGGVSFHAFNVDKDFANCIDGLILFDLKQLKADKRKRYIDIHL